MKISIKRTEKDYKNSINVCVIDNSSGHFINVPIKPNAEQIFDLSKKVKLAFNNDSLLDKVSFDISVVEVDAKLGEEGFDMEILTSPDIEYGGRLVPFIDEFEKPGIFSFYDKVMLPEKNAKINVLPYTHFTLKLV